eukprot:TRINITY_DN2577_c0_g1_i1.p1 TRINITY_DN2577_c0_g1~~TRINITY_DN2577_c0_g1_i1.p1  ORF type:complete len:395 (-),score=52.76 TRINITY_DN2577_c0_g1_i1:153-1337(-)
MNCPRGHPLVSALSHATGAWTCDICHSLGGEVPRHRCSACDYDVCSACMENKARCSHGHLLQSHITPSPGFTCDKCRTACGQGINMWGCRQCNFDMCLACFHGGGQNIRSGPQTQREEVVACQQTKRKLDIQSSENTLAVGEVGFLLDSCGFGVFNKPTNTVSEFHSEDTSVVFCRFQNVTPPGWCGGAKYEHHFVAVGPGTTSVANGSSKFVIHVVASDDPVASAVNEQAVLCSRGHALQLHITPTPCFTCDQCQAAFPEGARMWGCRQCDFDLCCECRDRRGGSTSGGSSNPSAGPVPVQMPVGRRLLGFNNAMPGPGAGGACRGYVILGEHAEWPISPQSISVLQQTVQIQRETYDFMARGLKLTGGVHDAVVVLSNGAQVPTEVTVETVC